MAARVLITTDGSDLALDAACRAAELLSTEVSFVVLSVIVTSQASLGFHAALLAPVSPSSALTAEVLAAAEIEAHLAAGLVASLLGPAARIRVERGEPGSIICEVAAAEHVGLIVVGSHGKSVAQRVVLGSVSHHVLQHALCPVLVVRSR